jgi:hypothetical protein
VLPDGPQGVFVHVVVVVHVVCGGARGCVVVTSKGFVLLLDVISDGKCYQMVHKVCGGACGGGVRGRARGGGARGVWWCAWWCMCICEGT